MKRVLFDENMPRLLRGDLPEYEVRTVQEEGWSSLQNGELLRRAANHFDVIVTADKRLQHQQNVPALNIAIIVVAASSTRLSHMRPLVPQIKLAVDRVQPGTVTVISAG